MTIATRTRVVLVDDHRILLDGLARLIDAQPDLEVVGTASATADGIDLIARVRPDVLVLDIAMADGGGFEIMRQLREREIPAKILILTMHGEDRFVMEAVHLGAAGYVHKRAADRELLEAIRLVAKGEGYLTPAAVRLLLSHEADPTRPELSMREREVLRLTARGFSNAEIAGRLAVSPKTIDTYRSRVMTKLDLHHRSELVGYALRHGIIGTTDPEPA